MVLPEGYGAVMGARRESQLVRDSRRTRDEGRGVEAFGGWRTLRETTAFLVNISSNFAKTQQ